MSPSADTFQLSAQPGTISPRGLSVTRPSKQLAIMFFEPEYEIICGSRYLGSLSIGKTIPASEPLISPQAVKVPRIKNAHNIKATDFFNIFFIPNFTINELYF